MAAETSNPSMERHVAFNAAPNPDRLKEVARKELGETAELRERCLRQLRTLVKDHNVTCIMKDDFLLRFLRIKKFDVQRSFKSLQNYSNQRAAINNALQKLKPETVRKFHRSNFYGLHPYRDAEGRLIVYFRTGTWYPSVCTDEEAALIVILTMYYAAEKLSSQTTGVICILDCSYIPIHYVPYFLRQSKLVFSVLFNGVPIRYPSLHFIEEPTVLRYILRVIDPYLPKKIKQRFFFHGSSREILFQHVDPALTFEEFGGTLGPVNSDHLTEELTAFLEKVKDEQRYFLKQSA